MFSLVDSSDIINYVSLHSTEFAVLYRKTSFEKTYYF